MAEAPAKAVAKALAKAKTTTMKPVFQVWKKHLRDAKAEAERPQKEAAALAKKERANNVRAAKAKAEM